MCLQGVCAVSRLAIVAIVQVEKARVKVFNLHLGSPPVIVEIKSVEIKRMKVLRVRICAATSTCRLKN